MEVRRDAEPRSANPQPGTTAKRGPTELCGKWEKGTQGSL